MHPYLGDQPWVTSYGLVLLVALATWWWLARRNAARAGVDPSHIDLMLPLALLTGIALSALALAFLPGERIVAGAALPADRRVRIIPVALGGMAAVLVYARAAAHSGRKLLDLLALPTLVALGIQRIGCFLAGCCWGEVAAEDSRLAVTFPAGSFAWEQHLAAGLIDAGALRSLPVHPTQLYEAALLAGLALGVRRSGVGRGVDGGVVMAAVLGYATLRFGVEFLRADGALVLGPLTLTQVECAVVVVGAVGVGLRAYSRDDVGRY